MAAGSLAGAEAVPCVYAYHEVIRSPAAGDAGFDRSRCDVFYQGKHSPDFYAWVFPHGSKTSIGTGSAVQGFELRKAVGKLREELGMTEEKQRLSARSLASLQVRRSWRSNM